MREYDSTNILQPYTNVIQTLLVVDERAKLLVDCKHKKLIFLESWKMSLGTFCH